MSETRETPDPWKNVETFIADICLPDGDLIDVDVSLRTEVDAARAAVERQHAEEIAAKDQEIADLKRKRVTKRELREYQDIEGDALTLRSYIKEQGETPMMTASLLKKATVELTTLREQLAAQAANIALLDDLRGSNQVMQDELAKEQRRAVALSDQLAACTPFLKDGETPAECIARNRADTDSVLSLLADAKRQLAAVQQERDELSALAHAVLKSVRDDEKGEQWTIRKFLSNRGVYNDDIGSSRRLVAGAIKHVIGKFALSSPSTQEPQPHAFQPVGTVGQARYTCVTCGEDEGVADHTPKPQQATCETHGHIYGHERVCLFCRTPKPSPEPSPATVCEWKREGNYVRPGCRPRYAWPFDGEWIACPYCTLPLQLSPEPSTQEPR